MKKLVLTVLSTVCIIAAFSQSDNAEIRNQGIVTYEEVVKFNIEIDGIPEELKDQMPKENQSLKVLYFNEEVSRYENIEVEDDELIEDEMEGGTVKVVMSQPENIVYRDFKNRKMIFQTDFMTRIFLIESDFPKDEWKLTGNRKMILDYPCEEAIKQDSVQKTSVWFTPAIGVSSGPDEYGNLPGLVLAVDINDGERSITAKSVKFEPVEPEKLKKPTKGKKVTQEKFESIVDEKNREMGGEGSGGSTIIIKVAQ